MNQIITFEMKNWEFDDNLIAKKRKSLICVAITISCSVLVSIKKISCFIYRWAASGLMGTPRGSSSSACETKKRCFGIRYQLRFGRSLSVETNGPPRKSSSMPKMKLRRCADLS